MANMEERKGQRSDLYHNIILESRERLNISGVNDVASFDEEEITLFTSEGTLLVTGHDLKINKLNVENGEVFVEGEVDSLQYLSTETKQGGFFSRLFK